jgi:HEAT repeat protein
MRLPFLRSRTLLALPLLALAGCGDQKALHRADALADTGDYRQAFGLLEAELIQHPKDKALHRAEIVLLLRAGRVDLAYSYYRKFIQEVSPNDDVLYRALRDKHDTVRTAAAQCLAIGGDSAAVSPLLKALTDPNDHVRRAAAVSLGDLKQTKAVPALIQALSDRWWYVRSEAAVALGKLRDPRGVAPLFKALRDPDSTVVRSAQDALGTLAGIPGADLAPYRAALQSPDPATAQAAALALSAAGDASAVPVLVGYMASDDRDLRLEALQALRRSRVPEAVPAAKKALSDPELRVRGEAVLTLLQYQSKDSLPALQAMADNPQEEPHLRSFVTQVIARIKAGAGN